MADPCEGKDPDCAAACKDKKLKCLEDALKTFQQEMDACDDILVSGGVGYELIEWGWNALAWPILRECQRQAQAKFDQALADCNLAYERCCMDCPGSVFPEIPFPGDPGVVPVPPGTGSRFSVEQREGRAMAHGHSDEFVALLETLRPVREQIQKLLDQGGGGRGTEPREGPGPALRGAVSTAETTKLLAGIESFEWGDGWGEYERTSTGWKRCYNGDFDTELVIHMANGKTQRHKLSKGQCIERWADELRIPAYVRR